MPTMDFDENRSDDHRGTSKGQGVGVSRHRKFQNRRISLKMGIGTD